MPTILVTGGAGFIGSNFVRMALGRDDTSVLTLDRLTYAGNPDNLREFEHHPRHRFVLGDICDRPLVASLLAEHRPTALVNFAAESHVDRSIDGPAEFVRTNVTGTFELLEACRAHRDPGLRFLHVSTDEVFGSLGAEGLFRETTPFDPRSPYAASKAAGDHLVSAYFHTYGLDAVTTHCSNNYGPRQFPEKLIPLMILNALEGLPLPVYGDGGNVRDWIHVDDHCRGLFSALARGAPGARYNLGASSERTNLEVVRTLCALLDELKPSPNGPYARLITFVTDRPGHDRRYAIDASLAQNTLGWAPIRSFEDGLRGTVRWYLDNLAWCARITTGVYRRERLGLSDAKDPMP